MALTIDGFMQMIEAVKQLPPMIPPPLNIIYDANVMRHTDERLYPESRHRSARIEKKLVRRHGGTFRKEPAMMRFEDTLYIHPALKATFEATIARANDYLVSSPRLEDKVTLAAGLSPFFNRPLYNTTGN